MQINNPNTNSSSNRLLYFLILLSGAAGLVYEVVWARQLTLFIGNTAIANAAVLTAFMLGLALGSLVLGRKADTIAKPLRVYALLEILIGCYGATTPWLFDILQVTYADFAGVVGVTGGYSHIPRFLIAIIAMLIPTFLMGGTLPLLVKHFAHQPDKAQAATSRIYGINTVGATLGAFSAGFVLLPSLGITNTLLLAAVVNVIVGFSVYHLLSRAGIPLAPKPESLPEPEISTPAQTIAYPSLLLLGFALSGFAALLYQLVWIHSLILVIGVSIYGFSTVLTVFLGGIGLGSLLVGRLVKFTDSIRTLRLAFYLQLAIALSATASLSLISQLPILFVSGWETFHNNFVLFQAYVFLLTAIVLLLPTILLGALFPLITGLWSNSTGAVGRGVGEAYGANALGTIAGAAIGGLFILDWLGIEDSLYLASFISMAVAALFWYMSNPTRSFLYRWAPLPLTALVLVMFIQALPGWDRAMLQAQVFRQSDRYLAGDIRTEIQKYISKRHFLYYKEGIHGTVSVVSWERNGLQQKALINNGKVDASNESDKSTQILLGQLPMFLHEAPKDVMVIGLGSGMTAGSVMQNAAVESMDVLEISPEVIEASYYFRKENYDVLNDPRTNLIVADARNHLLASPKTYDIIISEPSHSWVTGVSNLFTREFLLQAKKRLNEDGILAQWYHLYGVDRESLKSLLKSVSDVFSDYTLWYVSGGDILILSSNKPLQLDYQKQLSYFDSASISSDLARMGILSVEGLMNHMLMSSNEVQELLVGHQGNTDDHPLVEFNAPKHIYEFTTDDNIRMLFSELAENKYTLPFINLVSTHKDWIEVPFMGVRIRRTGNEIPTPEWKVVRISIHEKEKNTYRLMGGMNGDMVLDKPWGDVLVHTTMGRRGPPDKNRLISMLDHKVPLTKESFSGELRAPGKVIYWRVGPSTQQGKLNVVLARTCKKKTEFDNWVSVSSHFPGNSASKEDVNTALKELNSLLTCLQEN